MLAPSVVLAQVFVRQRLSAFPDHIGHTEHNLASFLKKLAFLHFFWKKTCFFLKNPYLCRVKSIFCEEELLYYPN
jgi:hypothetical protein